MAGAIAAAPLDFSAPQAGVTAQAETNSPANADAVFGSAIASYFDDWSRRVTYARSTQPAWSSPLVTTTALLEERLRYDVQYQSVGNGSSTINIGGGKGVDLIVSETQEIQIGDLPYIIHDTPNGKQAYSGFGDWPVFRFKQRLASSPEDQGDYIVSAWLQVQVPTGIEQTSTKSFTLLPTLGFGKGWGPVIVQATVGATIPTAYGTKLGTQINTNIALQYHLLKPLWPQLEVNWSYWANGQRAGLNSIYLTPGIVIGKFSLTDRLKFTFGVGYQWTVTPDLLNSPRTPPYNHAWLLSTRLSF